MHKRPRFIFALVSKLYQCLNLYWIFLFLSLRTHSFHDSDCDPSHLSENIQIRAQIHFTRNDHQESETENFVFFNSERCNKKQQNLIPRFLISLYLDNSFSLEIEVTRQKASFIEIDHTEYISNYFTLHFL